MTAHGRPSAARRAGRLVTTALLVVGVAAPAAFVPASPASAQQLARPSLRDLDMDVVPPLDVAGMLTVQVLLKTRGFDPVRVDGVSGPLTRKAITGFQERYGIRPRGEVDNQTLFALGAVHLAGPAR